MVKREKKARLSFLTEVLSNVILGIIVFFVAAFCVWSEREVAASGSGEPLYRNAPKANQSVSLMFNVYWGTEETYQILDILQSYGVKATFFIGGCWADDNVECLRAIVNNGHELGNHGYFHKDHTKLSLADNKKEIENCNRFIFSSVGQTPTLFAPPSGAYDENTLSAASALQMKTILWSKDTIDWRDKNPSLIYTRATKNAEAGDFILMHPTKATVQALPDIIKHYQKQSLGIMTVGENLQIKEQNTTA